MVFNGFWLVSMVFQGGFMVLVGFHVDVDVDVDVQWPDIVGSSPPCTQSLAAIPP